MEPPSKIAHGLAESKPSRKAMQGEDIAAGRAAGVAAKMPVAQRYSKRCVRFVAILVRWAADAYPVAAGAMNQQSALA
jgi:hypothetical protein